MIFETLSFNPGDFILKEGDIGKGFYILETGELEVTRDDKVINEITLAGAMFGELSELLCNKRDASIRAKTGAKVKYFDMELSEFVEKNPKFAVKIIRNLGRRLCRMNAVAIQGNTRNDFLKNITNPENSAEENRTSRLLVVDDKPMIIDQIKEFAKEPGWEVEGTGDIEEAIVLSENYDFNAYIISCSLPDEGAVELRRKLKTNPKSSNAPVVGMLVKGDDQAMRKASDAGFSHFISKPLEKMKVTSRLYEVLNLDASDQYFDTEDNILIFRVPKVITPDLFDEIKSSYAPRIRSTINDGLENLLIDLSNLEEVGEDSVEMVGEFAELIEEMGSPFKMGFVVEGEDADMWKNLDGCEEAEIFDSLDDAKSQMT